MHVTVCVCVCACRPMYLCAIVCKIYIYYIYSILGIIELPFIFPDEFLLVSKELTSEAVL